MYNSLNEPGFNAETRRLLAETPGCMICIGTDTVSIGVDVGGVEDVIVLDLPEDIDELVQKFGRPGRDRSIVKNARGILYVPQDAYERAKRVIEAADTDNPGKLRKGDTKVDISIAHLILASCKPEEQDRQYGNPTEADGCSCLGCIVDPRPTCRVDPCQCSGCQPENIPRPPVPSKERKEKSKIPRNKRLTRSMRALGEQKLLSFRWHLYSNADESTHCMLPPPIFLPDPQIKSILDCFALLVGNASALATLLQGNSYITYEIPTLLKWLHELDVAFEPIRNAQKQKARDSQRKRAAAKKAQGELEAMEAAATSGDEEIHNGNVSAENDTQLGDGPSDIEMTGSPALMSPGSGSPELTSTIPESHFYSTNGRRRSQRTSNSNTN